MFQSLKGGISRGCPENVGAARTLYDVVPRSLTPIKDTENVGRHQVLLVAAADGSEGLPPAIRLCFNHEVSMGPLTEKQKAEMLS
ncbi:hypothetical protein CRYUN_Cryun13aG0075800 [Craigia yunnanensis]